MAGALGVRPPCSSWRCGSLISQGYSAAAMASNCPTMTLAVTISRLQSTISHAFHIRKNRSSTGSRSGRHGSPSPSAQPSCRRFSPIPSAGRPMRSPGSLGSPQLTEQGSESPRSAQLTRISPRARSAVRSKHESEWQRCVANKALNREKHMKINHLKIQCRGYPKASAAALGIDTARWHCVAQVRAHHKYSIAANTPVPN